MHTKPSVLLVGSGRLAKHLKFWNSLGSQPLPLAEWNRTQSKEKFQSLAHEATHIWLAVSDSAIASLCEVIPAGKTVVHFSGALTISGAACAHPLMSFSGGLLDRSIYAKIHFVVNGAENLQILLPGFTNSFSVLSAEQKSHYHALCVIAGNFPQLLWSRTQRQLQELSIPTSATDLYLRQITENFIVQGEGSVTGPLVRKDAVTLQSNINSLSSDPKLQNIYSAFVREFSI